jgi:hypothetical protein
MGATEEQARAPSTAERLKASLCERLLALERAGQKDGDAIPA